MKQQVVRIHWWETKENYKNFDEYLEKLEYKPEKEKRIKWWMTLAKDLWNDFEVFLPVMPNKNFATYNHWKIVFSKVIPFLRDDVVLIGHSLWGSFLLKYLNENDFPITIKKIFLIAPAVKDIPWDVIGTFNFDMNLDIFKKYWEIVTLFHSKDDNVVPFDHFEELSSILMNSETKSFDWRWHFLEPTFPELIDYINKIK